MCDQQAQRKILWVETIDGRRIEVGQNGVEKIHATGAVGASWSGIGVVQEAVIEHGWHAFAEHEDGRGLELRIRAIMYESKAKEEEQPREVHV